MLPHIHHPVLFDFGFKIHTWGFIVALGFLFSILLARKYSRVSKEHVYNIGFLAVLGGIVGGRLLYFAYYPSEIVNFFKIWDGGMSIFGGLILSFVFIYIYIRKVKLNVLKVFDELIPWAVFGMIIGRVACLLGDGGHVGKQTGFFLGVLIDGIGYHLTALYSFIALVVLFVVFMILRKYKFRKGFFALFLIYYGITRFFIDFFRVDVSYYGFTIAQYLSIVMLVVGIIIWRKIK